MKPTHPLVAEARLVLTQIFGDDWRSPDALELSRSVPRVRGQEYLLIPVRGRLRWMLPLHRRLGGWAFSHWRPSAGRARVAWRTLSMMYSLGLMGLLRLTPGVHTITFDVSGDFDWLAGMGWRHKEPPVCSFLVGNPGTKRKVAVFPLLAGDRRPASVAKIPLCPGGGRSILREVDMVGRIAELSSGLPPKLLWTGGGLGDRAAYAMLDGSPAPGVIGYSHVRWLAALARADRTFDAPAATAAIRRSLSDHGDALSLLYPSLDGAGKLERLIALLMTIDSEYPAVISHGDFGPWNLAVDGHGRLLAFDWEDARLEWAPLFDLANACWMNAYVTNRVVRPGSTPLAAELADSYLESLGIPLSERSRLEAFYLAFTILESAATGERDPYTGFLLTALQSQE